MDAILLAAGVGNRLGIADGRPKALLEFDGETLLARHMQNLAGLGVRRLTICTGYRAKALAAVAQGYAAPAVQCVENVDYTAGSIKSLWTVRAALDCGEDVLLMDADVLYPASFLWRLAASPHRSCLLLDRAYTPGEEPVKVCVRGNTIVEFSKRPDPASTWDFSGESVGFFKLSPPSAARLAALSEHYIESGRADQPHEAALREILLSADHDFGFEEISGEPWIEIDFPADIRRAHDEILPAIRHA